MTRAFQQGICRSAGLLLLFRLLWAAGGARADTAQENVTIHFDASSFPPAHTYSASGPVSEALLPWQGWASAGAAAHDDVTDDRYRMLDWTNRADHVGFELVNTSHSLIRLKLLVRLPKGLWRADAAVVPGVAPPDAAPGAPLPDALPPSRWRMESLLLQNEKEAVRALEVRPGAALFLRWDETSAGALAARKAVRRTCWATADRALQDRVSGALMPVDDILDALPTLIERGDRQKITRRIHTALLATAKAQALWDNGRGDSITDRDSTFADLTVALSEVSCACFDLVPSQAITVSPTTGKPELRVGVTNAGSRTVPLVTLGVENPDGSEPNSDRTVYRSVAPGATVTARFPLSDPALLAYGVVQFLSDMGAATVSAAPIAPPAATLPAD